MTAAPNQAASGKDAIALWLHVDRLSLALPERFR